MRNGNILYTQNDNIKEFKNNNIYTMEIDNENEKAWMLQFSSVEDVIIFHGVKVIIF